MPLQEIIDWLGQKDEELSAQLPLRGDVLLVQQEKETHAVRSLMLPLPPFTAKMSCRWAVLPGTSASCHCPCPQPMTAPVLACLHLCFPWEGRAPVP